MTTERTYSLIPKKFHDVIKLEATIAGKTMTKYLNELANEAERRNTTTTSIIKERRIEHDKKKFTFRF